jgi:hypothetical protein
MSSNARILENQKSLRMSQVFQNRFDFRLMIVDFGFFDLSLLGAKARFQAQISNQKSPFGNHQSSVGSEAKPR